jgi:FkbM family methyltransferase
MLLELKNTYKNGNIEKHRYMEQMFNIHQYLFEYPSLIKDSPVSKIEITKEQVIFTISNKNENIKICCDSQDAYSIPMTFIDLSEFEAEENKMILNLIKPGDVVFDIGANIGWYTISILLIHKGTTVYAFEPIDTSFRYLKKNLILNNLDVDKIYNFGLFDQNKVVEFYYDIECPTASSMADLREDEKTTIVECEVKRLDDFVTSISSLERLDFIKCDVEGSELFVFRGAKETILKYKPIIFSEMLRKWSKKFNYHPNDIIKFFHDIRYDCFTINNNKLNNIKCITEETIETNFVFLNKDKHLSILSKMG